MTFERIYCRKCRRLFGLRSEKSSICVVRAAYDQTNDQYAGELNSFSIPEHTVDAQKAKQIINCGISNGILCVAIVVHHWNTKQKTSVQRTTIERFSCGRAPRATDTGSGLGRPMANANAQRNFCVPVRMPRQTCADAEQCTAPL